MAVIDNPISLQRHYYAKTASTYCEMHERAEHLESLRHAVHYLRRIGADSVLDTGCGTGLGFNYLRAAMPDLRLHGNDPSIELLEVAIQRYGIPADQLDAVSSEKLPYNDGEFDAVIETGMLHHVPQPAVIVSEMLRVARKAIFISDENSYGMGSLPARAAKLSLARIGMLGPVNRLRRGSHDWYYTEGDGVAWTYSVFDSYPLVRAACSETLMIPVGEKRSGVERWPRLLTRHCLLAGFKDSLPDPVEAGEF